MSKVRKERSSGKPKPENAPWRFQNKPLEGVKSPEFRWSLRKQKNGPTKRTYSAGADFSATERGSLHMVGIKSTSRHTHSEKPKSRLQHPRWTEEKLNTRNRREGSHCQKGGESRDLVLTFLGANWEGTLGNESG